MDLDAKQASWISQRKGLDSPEGGGGKRNNNKNTTYNNNVPEGFTTTTAWDTDAALALTALVSESKRDILRWKKPPNETSVQTKQHGSQQRARLHVSSFAEAGTDSAEGVGKCHLCCSPLTTFIFININPEKRADDTCTAVRGTLPS